MAKSKCTKNKYLRRLVRDYEIELQRPHGLKFIDKLLNQVPQSMPNISIFIGRTIHKEAKFISKYKGYNIISVLGMKDKSGYACDASNLYLK